MIFLITISYMWACNKKIRLEIYCIGNIYTMIIWNIFIQSLLHIWHQNICSHHDDFVIASCNRGYHKNNLQCHQWQQTWLYDSPIFHVYINIRHCLQWASCLPRLLPASTTGCPHMSFSQSPGISCCQEDDVLNNVKLFNSIWCACYSIH